jgi:hypothetical protein
MALPFERYGADIPLRRARDHPASGRPGARAGIEAEGVKDPPCVIIDEVAAMLPAATGIPWEWPSVILLFFLFRAFDILRSGPAAWPGMRGRGPSSTSPTTSRRVFPAVWRTGGFMWLAGS